MRIEQLQYLSKVAETGSITQAAKALYLSQPSLSNAIKELEQEMEVQLFKRSKKGAVLTEAGEDFLTYAQQILAQVDLLKTRYQESERPRRIFSVSAQHYAFVVDAFVRLLKENSYPKYQATLKESRTYEVIEDVANQRSEIGVLYRSRFNQQVIANALAERDLSFTPLMQAEPHIFIYANHPLADRAQLTLDDLAPYPKLSYEQGVHNSFYYWEEVLADHVADKSIIVSDRATLFNLLIGLDGYTICSGIINSDLNGGDILAKPLACEEAIEIGYITHNFHPLNPIGQAYIQQLQEAVKRSAPSEAEGD
ncbi:LysR family transcriptional regulator [Aerococcus sanguinicola]|uniref:LysR family transcriptional regulator n=1 Tax=unclassified Aerococcus TaxID=2618060 RepID=UPI0008A53ADF|nr:MULTISPECIES: LysR family transcriptional regulator [unclassified Aerococcus]KAB0646244.1 LysR family transcriptional regulator [Aerococcus sanguinicola]MDK6234064.1 LysR family transcriptional regulator [Aerococcus sp. UMB10185]MDK6856607.1 LysR family transcriptional regulator [Aerococcus sp. UMB7533]MDK8503098.1 LysR family transcriptional regulator [Aerococcus sp. UMB1112A]OFN01110.1 LysR family transcriptional regulator [Aerococcus sp. HMSC062A02]